MNEPPSKSQLLIDQSEDGRIKLDVRFEGETAWLTQPMMAPLFDATQQNTGLHLQNIFGEGELIPAATHKKYLPVRHELALAQAGQHYATYPRHRLASAAT